LNLELIKPPRLKPGATIGVAAVSGPVHEKKLDAGLEALRAKGYRVVEASNLRRQTGLFAGPDEERLAGYRALLTDPGVDAIFFARGGYGSARILPMLPIREARKHPKIHLGASDLTALFAFLWRGFQLVTFFGPMVAVEIAQTPELDWESVLAGEIPAVHNFSSDDVLAAGSSEGVLLGGCLSLLASVAGTPEALDARGAILFWEDTREEIYRLDRLLTQLERSGNVDNLRGMVIGSVNPGGPSESRRDITEYLAKRWKGAAFPVACNFPAGHLSGPRTLPLGVRVRLDLRSGAPSLTFLEAGVR
jgi:muramoyltetrapeptide carboxypeptidase